MPKTYPNSPKNGIYIGLEWLFIRSNWCKRREKDKITQKESWGHRFDLAFGGVYTQNSSYEFMICGMGKRSEFIVKSFSNQENLIPAISLKISK
ncbi:MAG: hypothetical protein ABJN84_15005 [Flavobacteriaceae bacterium]